MPDRIDGHIACDKHSAQAESVALTARAFDHDERVLCVLPGMDLLD